MKHGKFLVLIGAMSFTCAYADMHTAVDHHGGYWGSSKKYSKTVDCTKDESPEVCAKHKEMRKHYQNAKKLCRGKKHDKHYACMTEAICSKANDPKKCAEHHHKMQEACTGNEGISVQDCMLEQQKHISH
jgi:hypothetical protein